MKRKFSAEKEINDNHGLPLCIGVNIMVDGKCVANISGYAYEEYNYRSIQQLASSADDELQEAGEAFWLLGNKYRKFIEASGDDFDDFLERGPLCVYIHHMYVEEEYRNIGVATYLLNNFYEIIKYHSGYEVRYVLTYPYPLQRKNDHEWVHMDSKEEEQKMQIIMNKTLAGCGYEEINDSGYFARKYCGRKE